MCYSHAYTMTKNTVDLSMLRGIIEGVTFDEVILFSVYDTLLHSKRLERTYTGRQCMIVDF